MTQKKLCGSGGISPFARLRSLLADIPPGDAVVDMSIGEPGHAMPGFVGRVIEENLAGFGKYPPVRGSASLLGSIAQWHNTRYQTICDKVAFDENILVLNGSREGLFSAIFPALWRRRDVVNPAVLLPNPFYQCYGAAAEAAGTEQVLLPAGGDFLPDLSALAANEELLDRTVALYLNSPSNPQGAVADNSYLEQAIMLARQHDFMLFSDECYSEIYDFLPPAGALEAAFRLSGNFANVVSFNSLSKRSNLPGLRSGFCAGDPGFMADFLSFRNVSCPQVPLPVQSVSEVAWADEEHVEANRKGYRQKFELADRIFDGYAGYRRPEAGFFLWLDVGDGEDVAKSLWSSCGIRVLPGAYLATDFADGSNPAARYVRIALVHDLKTTGEALGNIAATVGISGAV
jgi:aspartate/methionine/tyrosine aminotransferase